MDMGSPGVFRVDMVRFGGLGKVKLFGLKVIKSVKEEFVGIHWMFEKEGGWYYKELVVRTDV